VIEAKKAITPERWSKRIRNFYPVGAVMLNLDKLEQEMVKTAA
jgi:hypothetical protein